jgi:hypothetical protein
MKVMDSVENDVREAVLVAPNSNNPPPYSPHAYPVGDSPDEVEPESSNHIFYAVELFIFAFVGWGWLAIREYIGKTPVLDAVVLISVMVSSLINLAIAVTLASSSAFAPYACAYFSHCIVLWVLYVYGFAESMRSDADALCCTDSSGNQGSTYTIGPTYASAFFGGLPMHQVPAAITIAFLTVLVLIAGAQARACTQSSKDWFVWASWLSIASLVTTHLGVFLMGLPVCNADMALPAITIVVGVAATLLVGVDLDWIMRMFYSDSQWKDTRDEEQQRVHRILRSAILAIGVTIALLYCVAIASVVGKSLSLPLILLFLILLAVSWLSLGAEAFTLYGSETLGIKRWTPNTVDSRARTKMFRGRIGQDMQIPATMMKRNAAEQRGGLGQQSPFLRRYPLILQGQVNRSKKSY